MNLVIKDLMILILLFDLMYNHAGTQVVNEVCFGLWGTVLIMDLFVMRKTRD